LIIVLIAQIFTICVYADHHHHQHQHAHLFRGKRDGNSTAHDPATMVKNALAVLAHVNKDRTENPNFNKHTFEGSGAKKETKATSHPLDYSSKAAESAKLRRRDSNTTSSTGNQAYSIPPELAKAARIVAESTPNKPTGNQGQVAAQIRQKYGKGRRDSNTPKQALVHSNGLFDYSSTDSSDLTTNSNDTSRGDLHKRDTVAEYWMNTMEQNGLSPFAPKGYKVSFRFPCSLLFSLWWSS
jgi:hypothetical protein